MKENRLTIVINKPLSEVFAFTVNPENTPLWIVGIGMEETNEKPVRVGTIYRNKGNSSNWNEYKVTRFKSNEYFELASLTSDYRVIYTYKDLGNRKTELEYYEWVEEGELEDPFQQEVLDKLKVVIESRKIFYGK